MESLTFRTQARTIDHLGREQIADCPTAISELWKNAYDAYARKVALHIFDGDEPVAAIFDDGHGMNYDEFVNRWLVIGTQSKYDSQNTNVGDRNGLELRTKQGQKGIGRLSSANLGPLLLIVSKRQKSKFVAALLDWRIFENPYLILSDIEVPVVEFSEQDQLFKLLPEMFERLTENVWGGAKNPERTKRLEAAWMAFDKLASQDELKPSDAIANTLINARFETRHLQEWSVWSGDSDHGTALLVSDLNFDLRIQLPSAELDGTTKDVRERFIATLTAFTDPLTDSNSGEINVFDPHFEYEVRVWNKADSKNLIRNDQIYDRSVTDNMEHVLEGTIDADGVFRGRVKAFGEWKELGNDYVIHPPADFQIPRGPNTFIGPVSLYVSTYERTRLNSTHSDDEFAKFDALSETHAGFLIFRNGLRVLPYGRIDNDFFEIEQRRSVSAGREFWNARRMFGRLALSREENPNLRDKAGREGFIDNRAAKALKILVINVLRSSANQYFGQSSDIRKPTLEKVKAANLAKKAEEDRKKLTKINRKKFREKLRKSTPLLDDYADKLEGVRENLTVRDEEELIKAQKIAVQLSLQLAELKITDPTFPLGTVEEDYRTFRANYEQSEKVLLEITSKVARAVKEIDLPKPENVIQSQVKQLAEQVDGRLHRWRKEITELQDHEGLRMDKLFADRSGLFDEFAASLTERVKMKEIDLDYALEKLDQGKQEIDEGNEQIFEAYISTLSLLKENIDVGLVASQGASENNDLRDQINRLNQLAQLGITVEILGHELNTYDRMISAGLSQLAQIEHNDATESIKLGYEGLSRQLEFLSPLKVSGPATSQTITGKDIFSYCDDFFGSVKDTRNLILHATPEFLSFSIEEQPSRLFPVFINLLNNSIYWLITSKTKRPEVRFSIRGGKVIVSDNGPGIDSLDIPKLFQMFFTRKISGGRGIGLYLCRVNLLAGGHHIEYLAKDEIKELPGANFAIEFKGATFE